MKKAAIQDIFSQLLVLAMVIAVLLFSAKAQAETDAAGVEGEASVEATVEENRPVETVADDGQTIIIDEPAAAEERAEPRGTAPTPRPFERAVNRPAFDATVQVRLTNLAANMSNRMEAAIKRLDNIADRLGIRIDKLRESGIETSLAEARLAEAKTHINNAVITLNHIDAAVANFVGSENPRAAWTSLKATYSSARDSILSAGMSLRATVDALKIARASATSRTTPTEPDASTGAVVAE